MEENLPPSENNVLYSPAGRRTAWMRPKNSKYEPKHAIAETDASDGKNPNVSEEQVVPLMEVFSAKSLTENGSTYMQPLVNSNTKLPCADQGNGKIMNLEEDLVISTGNKMNLCSLMKRKTSKICDVSSKAHTSVSAQQQRPDGSSPTIQDLFTSLKITSQDCFSSPLKMNDSCGEYMDMTSDLDEVLFRESTSSEKSIISVKDEGRYEVYIPVNDQIYFNNDVMHSGACENSYDIENNVNGNLSLEKSVVDEKNKDTCQTTALLSKCEALIEKTHSDFLNGSSLKDKDPLAFEINNFVVLGEELKAKELTPNSSGNLLKPAIFKEVRLKSPGLFRPKPTHSKTNILFTTPPSVKLSKLKTPTSMKQWILTTKNYQCRLKTPPKNPKYKDIVSPVAEYIYNSKAVTRNVTHPACLTRKWKSEDF